MAELPTAEIVEDGKLPRRYPMRFEIALVVLVAAAVFVPGIWRYSLVDPWETHYGEVARNMLAENDLVHTDWNGTSSGSPGDHEGFRSKPVLMFWMMAAGMRAMGVAEHGGYSGEMVESVRVMVAIRLPFIIAAIAGLVLVWWMLARLVSRRLAWLALLVVGSTPMYCLIARQAIPDMPMVACTMGAVALFVLAVEDGERAPRPLGTLLRGNATYDARHVVLAIVGGFVVLQALYYFGYFIASPQLGVRGKLLTPALWLPLAMLWLLSGLHRDAWLAMLWRLPCVLFGGIIAAIVNEPMPMRRPGQTMWRHVMDDILAPWDRHALDRYALRVLPVLLLAAGVVAHVLGILTPGLALLLLLALATTSAFWGIAIARDGWAGTDRIAEHLLRMRPITTMRQLFLLGCYFLLGVSVLAKGPPGVAVVVGTIGFYILYFNRWRALYEGAFEVKRGLITLVAVALPWHIAMWLKEGPRFVDEYWYTHILNRAGSGVDNSPGTFEYYTSQLGHGMWLWAALLPAALAAAFARSRRDTREGRVRFIVTLWAIIAVAVFCLVQTKFHHYILPAVPPLALAVAFLLDDLARRRERLHPLYAALGIGIIVLVCRDLMFEPDRWIEMFVFRYDRPWPTAEPYAVDPSDGFLALGIVSAIAIATLAAARRIGVALVCAAGLATCLWSLHAYMPVAGTHWGMREAIRTYYEQRTIYGQKRVYYSDAQLAADWANATDVVSFETMIPDTLQVGQPMTITIQLNRADDERVIEQELVLAGKATAIGDHRVEVTLLPGERNKLRALVERGKKSGKPGRTPPIRVVDADRLVAWQLYWRGENFWSGGEIWAVPLPEMKTSFVNTNNVEFQKYINDRTRAPTGRRYFLVTEAGRINGVRAMLPTQRARDSFEVLDTTSNKFSLASFWL
ncbi:MAG TPA: hypothetical protein VFQ53_42250 [Kofleriaceae bacterium]|nr:hypothetical protein [Kofleriaceae bacterium]